MARHGRAERSGDGARPLGRGLAIRALLCGGALAALAAISGCTTVRFNQKQRLAAPAMKFDADPLSAQVDGDILTAREGAIGGFSAGGAGGCGCN